MSDPDQTNLGAFAEWMKINYPQEYEKLLERIEEWYTS